MIAVIKKKGLLLLLALVILGSAALLYQKFVWIEVAGIVYREGHELALKQKAIVTASVIQESTAHLIDPRLTLAIIKQESRFQPEIRSRAGAWGLMQLRPIAVEELDPSQTNYEQIAKQLREDLAYNIHYGVAYFRHLLDRFDDHIAWALEAYNEGPSAVDRRYDGKAMDPTGYSAEVLATYDSFK